MKLGVYTVDRELGTGGMAEVYAAHDAQGHQVALKRLHASLRDDADLRRRIEREADIQRQLGHCPYVCACLGTFQHEQHLVLVLEYLDAVPLNKALKPSAIGWHTVVQYTQHILIALSAAHGVGVIHRDVKPSNIMVTRSGNAVLTDFGIAHVSHSSLRQTIAIGTVPYMSPEQIAGVAYPQTDLYSLGVTMYEACAGHLPFGNLDNREAIVKAVTSKEPFTCLERVCPQVPASYARIINRCIRKTYQERYANAAAALRDLQQCDGFNAAVQVPKVGGGFSPLAKLLNYICDAAGNFVTHARATQPALHQLQSAARLSVFYNGTLHSQYNLCNESFVIGRDAAQCNLVVMKDVISRRHAELKPRADGSWTLLDLSSNGTFFNSRCIGQGNSVVLPRNSRFRVCSTIDVEFLLE